MQSQFLRPNQLIENIAFIPEPPESTIIEILSKTTEQPNIPPDSYIHTDTLENLLIIGFDNPTITGNITKCKIYAYGNWESEFDSAEAIVLQIGDKYSQIIFDSSEVEEWHESDILANIPDLTIDDLNAGIATIQSSIGETTSIKIREIYIELETNEIINEPLPKNKTNASGYNYFCKHYVLKKNKGQTPYKLPDGTTF